MSYFKKTIFGILAFVLFLSFTISAYAATVTASALNVRTEPNTNCQVVGVLYRGQNADVVSTSNGWSLINFDGNQRYVCSSYLNFNSNQTTSSQSTNGMKYIGTYYITGYDPYCSHCCGKCNGVTASGTKALAGRTIAMKGYPYGTRVYIEGLGERVVEDTGSFKSTTIDVACNGHSACYAVTGYRKVYLI